MEDLRLKIIMLKAKTRKSYKVIAQEAGINYDCFLKFTSGKRKLTEGNEIKLITYLSTINKLKGEE